MVDPPSVPVSTPSPVSSRRSDATANRERILAAARAAFAEPGREVSMAEVSRRAGVGMATLYRNFPGRRDLLEAVYTEEIDAVCAAAVELGATPGLRPAERLTGWLLRFVAFVGAKHPVAAAMLHETTADDEVFEGGRARVLAAGRPLLAEAQQAGEIRADLDLERVLDLVIAVGGISDDRDYVDPILRAALDGLRPPADA